MVKVKFYGKLRQLFGEEMELDRASTIDEIVNALEKKNKEVEKIRGYLLFSVNGRQAKKEEKVKESDEVAVFLPPTGG